MKLLDFITYCTMKGIVVEHKYLDGYRKNKNNTGYRLHVQARGYTVLIEYIKVNDWTVIKSAVLEDHVKGRPINYNATLEEMVEAMMPNYNIAVKVANSEIS